jgi:hypothetical protein
VEWLRYISENLKTEQPKAYEAMLDGKAQMIIE